jgi:AcrR family transcriptional regulator
MAATAPAAAPAPERKRRNAYHHGNLRQALVDQAVRTIRTDGVEALTLRDVGAQLRVSRTALYRHFADKQALLVAVATEGFRAFRNELADAWQGAGRGREGFLAQGRAYIRFAMENPSHYRVMFGGYVAKGDCGAELAAESEAGFRVLVDALIELQQAGLVRRDPPLALAVFVWGAVHGAAMLAIGGQVVGPNTASEAAGAYTAERVWDAVKATAPTRAGSR